MIGYKFLNKVDEFSYESLTSRFGKFVYKLNEWQEVPGDGSYVSLDGEGIDSTGLGDTFAVLEVDKLNDTYKSFERVQQTEGVFCFKRVKLVKVGGIDLAVGLIRNDILLLIAARIGDIRLLNKIMDIGIDNREYYPNCGYTLYDTALSQAAENGHTEVVKVLLANDANIHSMQDYALRWAVENGHVETAKVLLNKGADIRARSDYALVSASYGGDVEMVKLLLDNYTDASACLNIARMMASSNAHPEVVEMLLDYAISCRQST